MSIETNNNEKEKNLLIPNIITMKKCLEFDCHYGCLARKLNPKMKEFVFCRKNKIHIFDLNKTIEKMIEMYIAIRDLVKKGGKILFVDTKEQTKECIIEQAYRSGSFFVVNRWLGGTLTNFRVIQKRIKKLKDLEKEKENNEFEKLNKKEQSLKKKELVKLFKKLKGIEEMRRIPQAIFVINPVNEINAINEAKKMGIMVFAIANTNTTNIDQIDYFVPANNNAIKSIKFILTLMADAIVEAKSSADMTIIAYSGNDEEKITMNEVINEVNKKIAEKINNIRILKQEFYEKMKQKKLLQKQQNIKINNNEIDKINNDKNNDKIKKNEEK